MHRHSCCEQRAGCPACGPPPTCKRRQSWRLARRCLLTSTWRGARCLPGGFPQGGYGHAEAPDVGAYGRPKPESAAALMIGQAMPVTGHPHVHRAGLVSRLDLETRRDHRPVLAHHPGVAVQLDAHQVAVDGEAFNHGCGVVKRKPDRQAELMTMRWTGTRSLVGAVAPSVHQRFLPGAPAAVRELAQQGASRREGSYGDERVGHGRYDLRGVFGAKFGPIDRIAGTAHAGPSCARRWSPRTAAG